MSTKLTLYLNYPNKNYTKLTQVNEIGKGGKPSMVGELSKEREVVKKSKEIKKSKKSKKVNDGKTEVGSEGADREVTHTV